MRKNLISNISLIIVLLCITLFFTACGVSIGVYSNITIDKEGKGDKVINFSVSSSAASNLTGGFNKLYETLSKAKPDAVSLSYEKASDGNTIYIRYSFDSISEYIEKTSALIGRDHDAAFVYEKGPFGELSKFSESAVLQASIQWALDAVENANLTSSSSSSWLSIREATVSIPLTTRSFSGDAAIDCFQEDVIPAERIDNVLSISADGSLSREIHLLFTNENYYSLDQEMVKKLYTSMGLAPETAKVDGLVGYKFVFSVVSSDEMQTNMRRIYPDASFDFKELDGSIPLNKQYQLKECMLWSPLYQGTYLYNGMNYYWKLLPPMKGTVQSSYYISSEADHWRTNFDTLSKSEPLLIDIYIADPVTLDKMTINTSLSGKGYLKKLEFIMLKEHLTSERLMEIDDYFKNSFSNMEIADTENNLRIYKTILNMPFNPSMQKLESLPAFESGFCNVNSGPFSAKQIISINDHFNYNTLLGGIMPSNGIEYKLNAGKGAILSVKQDGYVVALDQSQKKPANTSSFMISNSDISSQVSILAVRNQIPPFVLGLFAIAVLTAAAWFFLLRKRLNIKAQVKSINEVSDIAITSLEAAASNEQR